jgi:hypothetical protein
MIMLFIQFLSLTSAFKLSQQENNIHNAILRKMSLTNCQNLIPMTDKIATGYDMSKFDASGFYQPIWTGGSKFPFIKITCDNNQTWINPFTKITYSVPDQIPGSEAIKMQGGSARIQSTSYFNTYDRLITTTTFVSRDSYLFGMFSDTITMTKTTDSMMRGEVFFQASSAIASSYSVVTKPVEMLQPSELAQFYITKMVHEYSIFNSTSYEFYDMFMDYFGTHGVDYIMGGAKYSQLVTTANAFLSQNTYGDASLNGGFNILNFIDKSMGGSGSINLLDKKWLNFSNIKTSCLGGSGGCPYSDQSFNQWTQDAFSNPWLINMSIFPISKMLPSNVRFSYDMAVMNRFMKAYLNNIALPFLNYSLNAKYKVRFWDNNMFFDDYHHALYGFDAYILGLNVDAWCSGQGIASVCKQYKNNIQYKYINYSITYDYILASNQYSCGKNSVIVTTKNLISDTIRLVSSDIVYDVSAFLRIANELPILFAIFADAVVPNRVNGVWGHDSNVTFGFTCNYKQLSTSQTIVCDNSNAKYHDGINYLDKVFSYGKKHYNIKTRVCNIF